MTYNVFGGTLNLAQSNHHVHREWALLSFQSVCLSVIPRPTAYHDWSITTKFGRQVYICPRTRVSLFGSLSPILSVPGEKYAKFRLFPSERDASCHMTCWSVCRSGKSTLAKQPIGNGCRLGKKRS